MGIDFCFGIIFFSSRATLVGVKHHHTVTLICIPPLGGLLLRLKLQYCGHRMRRVTLWKRPWCWEGLGAGGEGDDRGWDGWMASLTRWTWVWVDSGSWWWTGRPGVLRFMGSQRVGHNWATDLNWTMNYENFKGIIGHSYISYCSLQVSVQVKCLFFNWIICLLLLS